MIEPLWRNGLGLERPFSALAGVSCRCGLLALQRVMRDFGADEAFGRVPNKLKEHSGIERPVSTIQRTTEDHAHRSYEQEAAREIGPGTAAGVIFVDELEGSRVPVVEPSPENGIQCNWYSIPSSCPSPEERRDPSIWVPGSGSLGLRNASSGL